jgi:hypothetical protein
MMVSGMTEREVDLTQLADVIDERQAVHEFMEAMSCSNVSTASIPSPRFLNAKRAKRGRAPIFEYRVLTLDLPSNVAANGASETRGANRASPRVHLRRGHIRRLEAKKIWVNAMVVGAKERGMIVHDYRVTARNEPRPT